MELTFRPAKQEDLFQIQTLHASSLSWLAKAFYPTELLEQSKADMLSDRYRAELMTCNLTLAIAAEEIVGSVGYNVEPEGTGRIRKMFISPSLAGKGIGSRLFSHVERLCRESGLRQLYAKASLNAESFYVKNGFKRECVVIGSGKSPTALTVVIMTKQLLPQS